MNFLITAGIIFLLVKQHRTILRMLPLSISGPIQRILADRAMMVIQMQTVVLLCSCAYMPFAFLYQLDASVFNMSPGILQPLFFSISNISYAGVMWVSLFSSGLTIVTNYGWPPFSFRDFSKVTPYLANLSTRTEFHFFFYSVIWMNVPECSFMLILIPARRALWSVLTWMAKSAPKLEAQGGGVQWRMMKPHWEKMKENEEEILKMSAVWEIVLGFWSFILFIRFGPMLILTSFIYWSFLQMRFHSPRSRAVHTAAWEIVEVKTRPIAALPGVAQAVAFAKTKFIRPGHQ